VDIGRELAQIRAKLAEVERASRMSSASLDDTALEVRDSSGSLRGIVGQQADGTTAVNIVNGPPPPVPSAPVVASVLGGVSVTWDGTFADGATLPLDWQRVEVHASTDTGFTPAPDTLMATVETPQGATVIVPTEVDVYVVLMARSTSGTASTPTAQVGPTGPAPVVATDIIDGIVTTVKLADDAVTAAKLAAAAVDSTSIQDDAITTPKIVAGAVQTVQLDTGAVSADKIAAGAVTTAKLDALAVTADKIAANAITAEKILAGSVTTTALAADAITGKTITGGTINGAEFHSDDGAGGLVDIADGTVIATAPSNWKIIIDPTRPLAPVVYFKDSTDYIVGSVNVAGTTDRAALYVASGELSDGTITDWRWVNFLGETDMGAQAMISYRTRQSDQDAGVGGWVYLGPDIAQYGLSDTETPSVQTIMQVTEGVFIMDAGRLIVDARPSATSALWVNVDTAGHTGNLLLLQREGAARFHVDKDGDATSAGDITALGSLITNTGLVVSGIDQGHGYVAFQARSTATTASSTEQIALTQTSVSLKTGRAYRIKVRGLAQNDTGNSGVRVRVRKTNTAGAIWLDSFTVTTPVAGANYQFINEQVIRNDTGATITTDLVMTYVRVAAGNAFLNTGNGLHIAFDVTDIGSSTNFATAQAVT